MASAATATLRATPPATGTATTMHSLSIQTPTSIPEPVAAPSSMPPAVVTPHAQVSSSVVTLPEATNATTTSSSLSIAINAAAASGASTFPTALALVRNGGSTTSPAPAPAVEANNVSTPAPSPLAILALLQQHQQQQQRLEEAKAMAISATTSSIPSTLSTTTSNNFASTATESSLPPALPSAATGGMRLNKFVRRLHDMLQSEQNSGIVEWRRGLLVLHSTDSFAKTILPKYFNTRNFKTFRRQLNYYGFVHVRSFSTTGSTTTALWVNRDLAQRGTAHISSVLLLKRVEPPCDAAKTAEGRRVRKELAVSTVEDDIGVSAKSLQLEQIRSLAAMGGASALATPTTSSQNCHPHGLPVPTVVLCKSDSLPLGASVPTSTIRTAATTPAAQLCLSATTTVTSQEIKPPPSPIPSISEPVVTTTTTSPVVTNASSASDITDTEDDAANLLIMLSRS